MKTHWSRILLVAGLLFMMTGQAVSQSGKISGVVKDAASGEVVVGANVIIEGTAYGAAANEKGVYYILNVPPGVYQVSASAVGYGRKRVTNVRVGADQIVPLDLSLQSEAIGLEEIVIEAERRIVDPSQTSSRTRLSADDFRTLPITQVYDLIQSAPSVYKGFVRGGKQFETKTLIDGVDVTDQFYAASADQTLTPYMGYNGIIRQREAAKSSLVDINVAAVEEANVLTGGVGAEYSTATAGLISYSLKEGRGKLGGGAKFKMSAGGLKHHGPDVYNDAAQYLSEKSTLAASTDATNRAKAERYTWLTDKYSYGKKATTDVEVNVGGGIMSDLGLFFTGGMYETYGRLPNEFFRRANGSLKMNYQVTEDIRLNVMGMFEDRGQLFGWKNRTFSEDFRFFLEGIPQSDGLNYIGNVKLTHVLSPSTFYELQVSTVNDQSRRGYVDGNNDGKVGLNESGDFLTFKDTSQVNRYMATASNTQFDKFFSPTPRNESGSETIITNAGGLRWKISRPGIFYEDFTNSNIVFKGDFTSQVTVNHQLRGGFQLRVHDFNRELRAGYIGGVFPTYKNYVEEIWNVKPKEFSVYAQDKMEYAGLIINVGARLDGLDLSAGDYANWFGPFVDAKDDAGGSVRLPVRGDKVKMKYFFSPRLGVSHPISEDAAMYFSFSRQTQAQPFSRLFSNYNDFGNPSLPGVVRVDQEPIKSTNYDLGVQWSFLEGYGLDVTAYYRDIENYGTMSFQVTPRAPWRLYFVGTNFGYADSRGVELTLQKKVEQIASFLTVGGRFTYAYSYIKEARYAGGNQTTFSTVGGDSAKYSGQLPYTDIRNFNTIEMNVLGRNSALTGGYDREHRITYMVFLKFPYDITLSSIGRFESGFFYSLTLGDPRARELGVGPWNKQIDLKLEKTFRLGPSHISLYVDVINALNWKNVLAYDNSSVGQIEWEKNGDPTGGPKAPRPTTQDGSLIYDIPREIYFGINISF